MKNLTRSTQKVLLIVCVLCMYTGEIFSQKREPKKAHVDLNAYEKLMTQVKEHRSTRLISLQQFVVMSKENKVIILDTRSDSMYAALHVKGAVHLNFSDFTQANLARVIPSGDYKILIYCNNNFESAQRTPVDVNRYLTSKAAIPAQFKNPVANMLPLTLALNIPTYINLYGYGYRNIYELSELVDPNNTHLKFEGTSLKLRKTNSQNKIKTSNHEK